MKQPQLNPVLRYGAIFSLVGLIVLCLVWELGVAPLRPGGSLLALKVLPLLLPLRGVLKGSVYTLQWASMLILLYFMEGVVRAWSDPSALSAAMGAIEIVLSLVFYLCAILYVMPAKKAFKASKAKQLQADKLQAQQAGAAQAGSPKANAQADTAGPKAS